MKVVQSTENQPTRSVAGDALFPMQILGEGPLLPHSLNLNRLAISDLLTNHASFCLIPTNIAM